MFRKLMSSLVESTMLYGAEIWGCNRDLEKIEQVQMRANPAIPESGSPNHPIYVPGGNEWEGWSSTGDD